MITTALSVFSPQFSALSFSLVSDPPLASFEDKALTVGMALAALWAVNLIFDIWSKVRPDKSLDERLAAALETCAGHCGEKIGDLKREIEAMKADRVRNMEDLWGPQGIGGLKTCIQNFSNDLNRAIGRLEGRGEMMEVVREIVANEKKPS